MPIGKFKINARNISIEMIEFIKTNYSTLGKKKIHLMNLKMSTIRSYGMYNQATGIAPETTIT